jgi:hypothetical protein
MTFQIFLFLLVFFFIISLALLWRLSWLHLQPSNSIAGKRRTMVQRLLKPRTPLDCPICRLCSSGVKPAPAEVAPLE